MLADRGLSGKSFFGRSHCPNCQKKLLWYDLVPLLSYILLGGRCRYCQKKIGWEYPLIELVSGVSIAYLFLTTSSSLPPLSDPLNLILFASELIFKTFFITVLLALFLTDLKEMLIPDRIILPAIVFSIIYLIALTIYKIGYLYIYLYNHPIGKYLLPPHSAYFQQRAISHLEYLLTHLVSGVILGAFFLLLIIVTKGKGMGGGDVKLGVFMGIGLGLTNSAIATMLAFLIGAIFSMILIVLRKRSFKSVVPFGPFLVVGSLIALFWGNNIMNWYLTNF